LGIFSKGVEHSGATHIFPVKNPRIEYREKSVFSTQKISVQSGDFGTVLEQMFHFSGPCPNPRFAIRLLKVVST